MLASCQRQSTWGAVSLGKGLGASHGRMGRLLSEVLCSSSGHLVWHCCRWGQAGPMKTFCSWTLNWGVRIPIPRVPLVCRLQQSTQRGQAVLGINSHTAVLTELPNAHCHGTSMGSVSSVQFNHSVMSDSLWPHGLQHARPPYPSPTPAVYANSCPLRRWCHLTISSSAVPFSFLQSFPASGSFPESVLRIKWSKYWSFSFSISPSNEYSGLISFRMDWLDLLAAKGCHKSLLQLHSSKASIFWCSAFFMVQLSHPYVTTGKTIALTRRTFVAKIMSLVFNMLSRSVIAFLPRSKCLLISWL